MGYFDRVLGKKKPEAPKEEHREEPPAPSQPEIVADALPSSSSFGPPSINASTINSSSQINSIMNPSFAGEGGASSAGAPPFGGQEPSQQRARQCTSTSSMQSWYTCMQA
jgi:hypothetical protein